MSKRKVLIAGAGMGGLCLAHALRRLDIDAVVFERESRAGERAQGYRLHLDSVGVDALRAALPPPLYARFAATAMHPRPFTAILDQHLAEIRRIDAGHVPGVHLNVNRATLRQILLESLDVRFGAAFVSYASDAGGVTARLSDGTEVRGDMLVGADGIHSAVRRQRLPQAHIQDTGLRVIYSRIPIERARVIAPQQALEDVFAVSVDGDKRMLGMGAVIFPTAPALVGLEAVEDYVTCIVGGRLALFEQDATRLRGASSPELCAIMQRFVASWPEQTRAIVDAADPSSAFAIEMRTSVPLAPFAPSNVTLLGDAIHTMTPTLGRGANMALHDAALLARHLASSRDPIAAYEADMIRDGFAAVRASASAGARIMGQPPLE